jgi:hypothetical protein
MSTLANVSDQGSQQPHRGLWVLLGAIAAVQLVAFWLLCSHQVRRAEARHNEVVVQQMALSDCLQYIPGSTIASCASSMGIDPALTGASQHAAQPAVNGAVPVSFSFR